MSIFSHFCHWILVFLLHFSCFSGHNYLEYRDAYEDIYYDENMLGVEPSFDVPVANVTVVEGQKAVLPCAIDNLSKNKVSWNRVESSSTDPTAEHVITMTFEQRRIVDDSRVGVQRNSIKDWSLEIYDVMHADQGTYLCTVNTDPVKSKKVSLHVKVPPRIVLAESSRDVVADENDTVSLVCVATGVPRPVVTWRRRHASLLEGSGASESKSCQLRTTEQQGIGLTGERLILENITPHCAGVYECTADNDVRPAVEHTITVAVQFPPEVALRNTRLAQAVSKSTVLDCRITAFPHETMYWEKSGQQIHSIPGKYEVDTYSEGGSVMSLSLKLLHITQSDYGVYTCMAANSLGRVTAKMVLDELEPATQPVIHYNPGRGSTEPHTPAPSHTQPPRPTSPHSPARGGGHNGGQGGQSGQSGQSGHGGFHNQETVHSQDSGQRSVPRMGEMNSNSAAALSHDVTMTSLTMTFLLVLLGQCVRLS